ncbi:hypothetical protein [Diplocloster modestus]|uniref:Uncharacterized protein n=1 Tax=Diplocloster modestus TaxID=2850322 RepID=A0ABS6K0N4_9FIRM|nr:hypothetical protein [Diplocloster modestus]MBU9724403.1 hypothetical protein [Diplocloster modestus]
MTITKRIKRFITEVVAAAMAEPDEILTEQLCTAEYTDQILTDDYCCVVDYATLMGIAIPLALRGAINPSREAS